MFISNQKNQTISNCLVCRKFLILSLFLFISTLLHGETINTNDPDSIQVSDAKPIGVPGPSKHVQVASVVQTMQPANGGDWLHTTSTTLKLHLQKRIWKNAKVYALLESGVGAGIDQQSPMPTTWNEIAVGDEVLTLAEFWFEYHWSVNRITAGRLDLSCLFDGNLAAECELNQFMGGEFVHNPVVPFPDPNPLGVVITREFSTRHTIRLGLAQAHPDGDSGNRAGLIIGEFEWGDIPQMNLRITGWSELDPWHQLGQRSTSGVSGSLNLSRGAITYFSRLGWHFPANAEVHYAWSGGIEINQRSGNRRSGVPGLAIGINQFDSAGHEPAQHLEVYYSNPITDWLIITPDIQWACYPTSDDLTIDTWVLGLRILLNY